jgi:hypothetical protein
MTNYLIQACWLAGFIDGDGCFYIHILKNNSIAIGFQVQLSLIITQHVRDAELLKAIITFLGGGTLQFQKNTNVVHLRLRDFNIISTVLIPLLNTHPLKTTKRYDFEKFLRVHDMMKRREHLTLEGLEEIRAIKARMNRGRK